MERSSAYRMRTRGRSPSFSEGGCCFYIDAWIGIPAQSLLLLIGIVATWDHLAWSFCAVGAAAKLMPRVSIVPRGDRSGVRSPDARPVGSPDRVLQASAVLPEELSPLFVKERSGLVVKHPIMSVGGDPYSCRAGVNHLVVPEPSQVDKEVDKAMIYYVLDEFCFAPNGSKTERVTSIRSASFSLGDRAPSPLDANDSNTLLTYWWPASSPNGTKITDRPLVKLGVNMSSSLADAAVFYGLDLTRSQSNLDVSSEPYDVGGRRIITSVSVIDGSRSSIDPGVSSLQSLALDPADNNTLYISDNSETSPKILSAPVSDSGLPAAGGNLSQVLNMSGDPRVSSIDFGPYSFVSGGSCMYFRDDEQNRVWGFDPRRSSSPSSSADIKLVAGSGIPGSRAMQKLDDANTTFNRMRALVTTPDGCNLFVTDEQGGHGLVRWLKLERPCSLATRVEVVANHTGTESSSLALHRAKGGLRLLLGSSTGDVFQLIINESLLANCSSPPPSSASLTDATQSPTKKGLNLVLIIALAFGGGALTTVLALLGSCYYKKQKSEQKSRSRQAEGRDGLASTDSLSRANSLARGATGLSWSVEIPSILKGSSSTTAGSSSSDRSRRKRMELSPSNVQRFELKSLADCTGDFHPSKVIGDKGAFGVVYRGSIDGRELAMKVMTGELTEVKKAQFVAEVNTLSRLNHANLVELVGFCQEGEKSILVYPYYAGGSLQQRLHGDTIEKEERRKQERGQDIQGQEAVGHYKKNKHDVSPLTIEERMRIAFQVAKGLSYLHDGARPAIIHRDIKSSNVLLGEGEGDMVQAVVADFGLAAIGERVFGTGYEHFVETSHVGGTFGYISPEYMLYGKLSEKNDVYSFGVLLLELLTGRKAAWRAIRMGWETLATWVGPFLTRGGDDGDKDPEGFNSMPFAILDPSCCAQVARDAPTKTMVMEAFSLAGDCVKEEDRQRPSMTIVVQRLRSMCQQADIAL